MSVESATYISDLNATYPASGDPKSEGDDHLRLIKTVVKATFPSVTGAVTASHTQLNYVTGVTSAIQTQLDAKAPTASPTFTGTVVVPTPSTSTGAANKTYVDSAILNASLSASIPGQTGNAGKYLTTDGSNASWGTVTTVSTSAANSWTGTQTFKGIIETVYSLTGTDIDPANGSIQYKTLSGNTTFTESLADGQAVTLMLNPATYTTTWPTTTWISSSGNTAPTLTASVYNVVILWQVGGTLYGRYAGHA